MMVSPKEIIEALRMPYTIYGPAKCEQVRNNLANRIEAEGIAPPDGVELIADIEGIGCCTVVIRNGRVYISAVTVRDIINIGAGKIAPPDGMVLVADKPIGWHYRNKFYLKGSDEVRYCQWHECIDEADAKHYESIGCDVRAIYAPMLAAAPKGVSDEQ